MAIQKYNFYAKTNVNNKFLEYWTDLDLPLESKYLETVIIENRFTNRPDLMSYYYYNTPRYLWIFKYLNPGKIKNPIYDFIAGKEIKIYKSSYINTVL